MWNSINIQPPVNHKHFVILVLVSLQGALYTYPISFITVPFALLDLVKEEVIVILASQFMMFFNETALEVCI